MADSCNCPKCKKGAPGWLVTFGDMMALLLTFFILLLSMSQFEIVKFKKASGSLKDAFGTQKIQQINAIPSGETMIAIEFQQEIILVRLKEKLEVILVSMIDNGEAELVELEEGFLVRLDQDTLFLPGTLMLNPEVTDTLQQIANLVLDMPNLINIAAHSDDQQPLPGSPFSDNWSLTAAHAAAVVNFFATKGEVEANRLQARGMSQYTPRESNATEQGRAKNRRIEILISRQTAPVLVDSFVEQPRFVEPGEVPIDQSTNQPSL